MCRRARPKEEGDVIIGFQATHEEKFLNSWLGEDGRTNMRKVGKETKEETGKKRI